MDQIILFAQPVAVAVIAFASVLYLGGSVLFSLVIAVVPTAFLWLFRNNLGLKLFGAGLFAAAVLISFVPADYVAQISAVGRQILSMQPAQIAEQN